MTHNADEQNARHLPSRFLHADITSQILASAVHIHKRLGFGFLEAVYRRAIAAELRFRNVGVLQEVSYKLEHRESWIGTYRADIVVAERVIVEVKTGLIPDPIGPQLTLNYLKASGLQVGLFIHFGPKMFIKRVIYTHRPDELPEVSSQ